jgi:very-short-patch-repair endonuclease
MDGSQQLGAEHSERDKARDASLASLGLRVLRFNSRDVLIDRDAVVETIYGILAEQQVNTEIPPGPL